VLGDWSQPRNGVNGADLTKPTPLRAIPKPVRRRGLFAILVIFAAVSAPHTREAASAPAAGASAQSPADDALAKQARTAVEKLAKAIEAEGGRLGAEVIDIRGRRSVGASSEHLAMNPASNAKIGTAVAALELLGAEHRFVTGLYGELRGTKVDRLVLRGQGDPTLTTGALADLARELRAAGVTEVGSVAVDQSYFDERYVPPAFDQQPDEWAAFRAPVAAVSLERNTVTFWVQPGEKDGEAAVVAASPPGFVELSAKVTTSKSSKAEKVTLTMTTAGDRLRAELGGTIPEGSRKAAYTRRVDDPRKLAGLALAAILRDQGVKAPTEVSLGGKDETRALALHTSAPLGEIVHRLGKDSDNFTAEMLFRATGAKGAGDPTPEAAVKTLEKVLTARGAFEEGERIVNGSGLFDANRATAHSIATVLVSAASDPRIAPEFVAHLAIGGVDGTLRSRLRPVREKRSIRAKTGTLAKSVALSGYVLDDAGQPRLAFSFIVETPPGKTRPVRDAIDDCAVALARALSSQN
jgi:serine-type D-Ala-D-Ala carboxypeptidase/endopeptidase (penicillin-binding protein 4)